jgi:hypothetical protein
VQFIQKTSKLLWVCFGLMLTACLLTESAWAHGERSQEPYLRTRTVQYYDSDAATVHPGNTFMVRGGVWY